MPAPLLKQSTRRLSTMRLMAGMHENTPAVGVSRAGQGRDGLSWEVEGWTC